jgi:phosphoribosylanthranilate isomerase
MKIKVCGLRYPENIKAVTGLSPDYMGFIFYGPSPRFVDDLLPESLNDIPASVSKTGVFVNESKENINALIDKYRLNAIQLHGNEDPEFCDSLRGKVKVLKAFGLSSDFDFSLLNDYINKVDFFLFDTKTALHGGSGQTFDWNVLDQYKLEIPFFLSGGIGPQNIEEVKDIEHSQFYGVDLNSKFEVAPGVKNIQQLEKAFDIIKHSLYK